MMEKRLKLGKLSWIIMTVGVCVIAFASVGVAHSQRVDEQDRLNGELELARLRLSKIQIGELNMQKEELEEALTQAISEMEEAKQELMQPNESIPVFEELFVIAKRCNVQITEIHSQGLDEDGLVDVECTYLPVNLRASGTTGNLIVFAKELNNDFKSGFITSVEIGIPESPEGGQPEDAASSTVSVNMLIYSYEGK